MDLFQIVAIVVSLALTAVAAVLVTKAVQGILAVVRTGGKSMNRSENPVGRTVTMVKETFLHTRMLQWTVVGIMHWFVYFAFIVLGAAVFTAYFQLFSPEFQLPIVGHFVLYEWLGEALGVLGTIGIVYLAYYRQKHHPRREGRDSRFYRSTMWQAYFVEAMALLEGSAILFIRGAEYNLGKVVHAGGDDADHYTRLHFPVAGFFGDALYPDSASSVSTLKNIIFAIAMIKIVLAMIWLIVIARNLTMGVAWHRFTAWFNIWWKREPSGRTALGAVKPLTSDGKAITLDDIDDLDEDSKLGVGSLEDFSWKNILDFTTCTECGRCQSQCPAWNTEKPLNPKLLITAMRDATYARAPYTQAVQAGGEEAGAKLLEGNDTLTREVERPLVGNVPEGEWFYNPESGAAVIDAEVLWNCTSCGACVQQCPVDIEHVDHIIDMRRYAVLVESNFPTQLNGLFKGLENKGNPWNMSSTARLDWAKGLDFEVKVVGETIESLDEVDWLFWVGCAGAYEDRAKKTTRAVAELLDLAGVSFGVLGNGETCTGDPARRAGNEFVFQGLAQENVATLTEAKAKKVVSTCAHCFNTLKNEYKDFGIELEVIHHTQLLNRLVREGKLTPVNDGAGAHKRSITYHDPCYIGRHNGVYEPPRELLQVLPGAEFVEMERNSERSFCCGAGGARMWMEENIGTRINVNRTIEAVGTGADQIAVGCPFCRVMLSDGLTAQQAKGEAREEVEVLDVAQMLLASIKGEMATKLAPGAGEAAGEVSAKAAPSAPSEDKTSEETRAEPSADDDTQTVDPDNTVTDTADAGPLAKASGGTSLFDDPAESETAAADATPAEEAKAATPASSGGSLFDVSGDDDVSDDSTESADAQPAAAKAADTDDTAAPDADAAAPTPAAGGDLGSGGSLFDVGTDSDSGTDAAEAMPEPDVAKPSAAAAPAPADEQEAEAELKAAPAEPTADLGSGGSLFDIASPTPTAAAEKASAPAPVKAAETPAPAEPTPAVAAAASTGTSSTPGTEIPDGGSLFDIEAPAGETVERPAAAEPEPVTEPEPDPEPAAEPEPEPASKAEPAAAPASSGSASTPGIEIPDGGSLFDIEAPAATTVERPAAQAVPEAAPEPEPEPEPVAKAEPEPVAEPEPEQAAPVAGSGTVSTPGTEIPEGGSLFDIVAPAATTVERPAAAQPEPETAPEPQPEPTAEPQPEPAADPEPTAETEPELTPAQRVSAAATAAANNGEDEPAAPEAEAIVAETPGETDEAETGTTESEEPAEEPAEDTSTAEQPKPAGSGATHTPKTDVDITEAGSLFDL